jgi:hypothetical protein
MALPDVKQMSTEDLDALRDAITLGNAGTFLQLRHPGYGWVGYLIPPQSRAQLVSFLLQHALMPAPKPDAPPPSISAGGGTVH